MKFMESTTQQAQPPLVKEKYPFDRWNVHYPYANDKKEPEFKDNILENVYNLVVVEKTQTESDANRKKS